MKKVLMLLCMVLLVGTLVACEDSESTSQSSQEQKEATVEKVIADNDFIKATYLGITEQYGQVVLAVKLENKTDKEITVIPTDSSVDDTMILFTSGIPATMQPGKSFNQGWLIGGVPEKNVEFKMSILDDTMTELFLTDVIKIEK